MEEARAWHQLFSECLWQESVTVQRSRKRAWIPVSLCPQPGTNPLFLEWGVRKSISKSMFSSGFLRLRASFQSRQPAPRPSKAQEVTPNTKEASASRAKLNISLCAHRISSTLENPWIISRSASGQCKNNQPWQQLPGTSSSLRLPGQPTTLSSTADMGTYLPSWPVLWDA